MIELSTKVHAVRRSKIAFWTVAAAVAVTTAVIGSAVTAPFRAVAFGVLAGGIVGFVAALVMFCWPAIRVAWHWAAELTAFTTIMAGYLLLASVLPWWAALAVLVSTVGGPLVLPPFRHVVWQLVMCAVSRHRLRVCFSAFIASTRTGMTPLILWARPIPAGERVWIWLRPGLALADLENRLDRLAAGCWASECRIAPASRRFSALLRVDLARRNPLTAMVGSPLPGLVPGIAVTADVAAHVPSGGLDLPDTQEPVRIHEEAEPKRRLKAVTTTPASPEAVLRDVLAAKVRGDADLADWI